MGHSWCGGIQPTKRYTVAMGVFNQYTAGGGYIAGARYTVSKELYSQCEGIQSAWGTRSAGYTPLLCSPTPTIHSPSQLYAPSIMRLFSLHPPPKTL